MRARLRGEEVSTQVSPAVLAEMGLEAFSRSDLSVRIESRVLGETVIFAGERAKVAAQEELVVYRGDELLEARKLTNPDDLRFVHQVKRLFNGRILQGGPHG